MAVKHAALKRKELTNIMKMMDKVSGHRLSGGKSMPEGDESEHSDSPLDGENSEPEETDDAPADHAPQAPAFTWAEHNEDDGQGAGDEEDAPSDDDLDAMEAKLKKHGRR